MSDEKKNDGQIIPEVVLASEKVQFQNHKAVVEYVKTSREMIKTQNIELEACRARIHTVEKQNEELRKQLALLQQRVYAGGTS